MRCARKGLKMRMLQKYNSVRNAHYCSSISVIFDLMQFSQRFLIVSLLLISLQSWSQYTPIINSNRPGASMGAFGVGPGVYQVEWGIAYRNGTFQKLADASYSGLGTTIHLRTGLFLETFELIYQLDFQSDELQFQNRSGLKNGRRAGLKNNSIGVKHMLFDPFRNTKWYKPNLYSWKANQGIRWIELIPAIAVYGGSEVVFEDSFPYTESFKPLFDFAFEQYKQPMFTGTFQLITQNHLASHWVLVTNWGMRYFGSKYPSRFHAISLTVNLNDRWSAFVEEFATKSALFSDVSISTGMAYLLGKNLQIDIHASRTLKETPMLLEAGLGLSYRLDRHIDKGQPHDRKLQKSIQYNNKTFRRSERKSARMLRKNNKQSKKLNKEQRRIERKLKRIK